MTQRREKRKTSSPEKLEKIRSKNLKGVGEKERSRLLKILRMGDGEGG